MALLRLRLRWSTSQVLSDAAHILVPELLLTRLRLAALLLLLLLLLMLLHYPLLLLLLLELSVHLRRRHATSSRAKWRSLLLWLLS